MSNKTLVIIGIVSLSFPSNILCMNQADPYQYDHRYIIKKHATELATYKAEILTLNKNLSLEYNKIITNLLSYQKHLLIKKQGVLDAFKNRFKINDSTWKSCLNFIENIEQFNKNNQENLTDARHDKNIPQEALSLITNVLKNNNINPQRIRIEGKSNCPYEYRARLSMPTTEISTLKILPPYYVYMGMIEFNLDIFSQLSPQSQGAYCMLIAEQFIQSAPLTPSIIAQMESQLGCSQEDMINSMEFKILHSLHLITLPTLLLSIKDDTIAECLLIFHTERIIAGDKKQLPRFLNHNDYNMLCEINRHWNALRWIKKYKNSIQT